MEDCTGLGSDRFLQASSGRFLMSQDTFPKRLKTWLQAVWIFSPEDPLAKGLSPSDWPAGGHLPSLDLSLKPEGGIWWAQCGSQKKGQGRGARKTKATQPLHTG